MGKKITVIWEQELYEMLCDSLIQLQTVLSQDPDSPSASRTYKEAEGVLGRIKKRLMEEELLPRELEE